MKKFLLLIVIFVSVWVNPFQSWADASLCAIDNGPPQELTEYIVSVNQKVGAIRGSMRSAGGCSGAFSQEKRIIEMIDRVETSTPGYSDMGSYTHLITDFSYNIKRVIDIDGGSHAVKVHGDLIKRLETNLIIPAMDEAARSCALDSVGPSGGTIESELMDLLQKNKRLESYYRNVALGSLGKQALQRSEPDSEMQKVYVAIAKAYDPAVIKGCKSEAGYAELMSRFQGGIQGFLGGIDRANQDWKEAIELFSGKSSGTEKYHDLQKRLLVSELARQGVSREGVNIMLQSLSCYQRMSTGGKNPLDARASCANVFIDGIKKTFSEAYGEMKHLQDFSPVSTIGEYIVKRDARENLKQITEQDIEKTVALLDQILLENTDTDQKAIKDLLDLHTSLNTLNQTFPENIRRVRELCMRGQPSISCPR